MLFRSRVSKSGAKFDPEKTKWFNEHYLRTKSDEELGQALKPLASKHFGLQEGDRRLEGHFLSVAAYLLKERVQFESEFIEKGNYLFVAPDAYDEAVIAKRWKPELAEVFESVVTAFRSIDDFSEAATEATFKEVAVAHQRKPGELLQLFRVLVSGQGGGVHLFGMVALLGKDEVVRRIEKALTHLKTVA